MTNDSIKGSIAKYQPKISLYTVEGANLFCLNLHGPAEFFVKLYQLVYQIFLSVLFIFVVNPQEATELPGNSDKLESGVVPLRQPQDSTKTRDDRHHVELTLPSTSNFDCVFLIVPG